MTYAQKHWSLPRGAFFPGDCGEAAKGAGCEGWNGGLHPDLDGLERAQGDVGDEFGRSTGGQVESGLVAICVLRASYVGVELLEEFVPSVLESTLSLEHRQPKWEALSGHCHSPNNRRRSDSNR